MRSRDKARAGHPSPSTAARTAQASLDIPMESTPLRGRGHPSTSWSRPPGVGRRPRRHGTFAARGQPRGLRLRPPRGAQRARAAASISAVITGRSMRATLRGRRLLEARGLRLSAGPASEAPVSAISPRRGPRAGSHLQHPASRPGQLRRQF
ncbi:hypothetical protein T492DRAFT_977594 [Pavlovales sp. CCMP2436]|nr:hypothetical protein T492DRAFT_977594 [Pavlovales sp. CCMP2436]